MTKTTKIQAMITTTTTTMDHKPDKNKFDTLLDDDEDDVTSVRVPPSQSDRQLIGGVEKQQQQQQQVQRLKRRPSRRHVHRRHFQHPGSSFSLTTTISIISRSSSSFSILSIKMLVGAVVGVVALSPFVRCFQPTIHISSVAVAYHHGRYYCHRQGRGRRNYIAAGARGSFPSSSPPSSSQLSMILPSLLNTDNNKNNSSENRRKDDRGVNSDGDDDDEVLLKNRNSYVDVGIVPSSTGRKSAAEKTNSNETDDDDDDKTNQEAQNVVQGRDFSTWVEGLTQWPRYPSSSGSANTGSRNSGGYDRAPERTSEGVLASASMVGEKSGSPSQNIKSAVEPQSIDLFDSNDNDMASLQSLSNITADRIPRRYDSGFSRPINKTSVSSNNQDLLTLLSRPSSAPSRYRGINPLSNFIKFEAILDLASSVSNETEPYFNNVFAAADRLFQLSKQQAQEVDGQIGVLEALEFELESHTPAATPDVEEGTTTTGDQVNIIGQATDMMNVTTVEDLLRREDLFGLLPFTSTDSSATGSKDVVQDSRTNQNTIAQAAESLMKDTTARIEYLVNEASSALSPNSVQDLIVRASKVFSSSTLSSKDTDAINKRIETVSNDIFQAVQRITRDGVVDTQFATDLAKEAAAMAAVANIVLGAGYAYGSRSGATGTEGANPLLVEVFQGQQDASDPLETDSRILEPLFVDYESAERIEPFEYDRILLKGAEMGVLAGAIYEDTLARCRKIGHSLVATGTTANVAWMVTDSMDFESHFVDPYDIETGDGGSDKPILTRTITIRGFDASDDTVDREQILNEICSANPEPLNEETSNVALHSGLLAVAKQIYSDTNQYIDWMSPNHRLVLNGHSIGGSLSILLLLIITSERGLDFVFDRILRVYTHGSPPIAAIVDGGDSSSPAKHPCSILAAFGLPSDYVYNYIQPYDPIVRLFTKYDPLYPLVDDLGADEVTLYSTGPMRSLRPIARGIFQAWEGWPKFREVWKGTTNQEYQSVGIQYLLMPDPLRYLNDRFLSVNVGVPPTEALVRISSDELLPALDRLFPLDVFLISQVPQAVRSFLHHFYPAYDSTILNYASKLGKTPNKNVLASSLPRNQYKTKEQKRDGNINGGRPSLLAGRRSIPKTKP